MKTKTLLLGLILMVGLFAFNSCEKDDDPSPLTQEEAVVAIDDSEEQFIIASNEIATNAGYKVQDQLEGMYLPFGSSYKSNSTLKFRDADIKQFKQKATEFFKANKGGEDLNFDFDFIFDMADANFQSYTGTWNWSGNYFVKAETNPANEIVLNFPYPSSNATNNATLRYYSYQLSNSSISFKGTITVDKVEVLSFSLSATFSETKMSGTLTVKFGNYEMLFTENMTSSTTSYVASTSTTLQKSGKALYKESTKVTLKRVSDTDVSVVVEAKLIISSLEFRMKLSFKLSELETIENKDPNTYLQMSLYSTGGAKIGDFKYKYNSTYKEWDIYFVYTNGVEVNVETEMPRIAARLLDFFGGLFDNIG